MPDQGVPSRGDDTRAQLLAAALKLFAVNGFDGVTTRQLSQEAGTNIAAIAYHFGGKQELYRAVLHQLVDDTEGMIGPAVVRLREAIASASGDRPRLALVTAKFIGSLLRMFIDNDFMKWRAPLVMREYALPSPDFGILYEGRIRTMHELITHLAAAATDRAPDDPACAVMAHTVMGQILVFGVARVVLWQRLDWQAYTTERVDMIERIVVHSVLASFGLAEPATGDPAAIIETEGEAT